MITAPLSNYNTQEIYVGFVGNINFNTDRPNIQQKIQEILSIYNKDIDVLNIKNALLYYSHTKKDIIRLYNKTISLLK